MVVKSFPAVIIPGLIPGKAGERRSSLFGERKEAVRLFGQEMAIVEVVSKYLERWLEGELLQVSSRQNFQALQSLEFNDTLGTALLFKIVNLLYNEIMPCMHLLEAFYKVNFA